MEIWDTANYTGDKTKLKDTIKELQEKFWAKESIWNVVASEFCQWEAGLDFEWEEK